VIICVMFQEGPEWTLNEDWILLKVGECVCAIYDEVTLVHVQYNTSGV
jgi:hypothetical protein